MRRERLARAALLAFPPEVRMARGEEMLGTLLDASATSRPRFAREVVDMVRSGLGARALESARAGPRRVIADGVCLAAVWLLTLFLSSDLALWIKGAEPGYPDGPLPLWSVAPLVLALALALVGYDRLAGAMALLFTASVIVHLGGAGGLANGSHGPLLVATLCFGVLLLAPRPRAPDPRRLAWLALSAAFALVASTGDDAMAAVVLLALIFLVPPALALLPTDPRLAIACALPTMGFGLRIAHNPGNPSPLGWLVVAMILTAAPLVLAIAVARTRRLRARVVT
jgi:hypothetical protein